MMDFMRGVLSGEECGDGRGVGGMEQRSRFCGGGDDDDGAAAGGGNICVVSKENTTQEHKWRTRIQNAQGEPLEGALPSSSLTFNWACHS